MLRRFSSILGNRQRLDGGAMFGNAPKMVWQKWAPADEQNRIELATRALFVREPSGRNVLFEAGIGAFFEPKLRERFGVDASEHILLSSLQNEGILPHEVDVVVLSHLHFDHAGGILSAYTEGHAPRLVFDKARFVVSKDAFLRAQNPHARDRASFIPGLVDLLTQSGRLELVDGPTAPVLGDGYRLHYSDGHTPGLLMTEIGGSERSVLFVSDLIPGVPWLKTAITMGYDRFAERLIDEKTLLLKDAANRRVRLFFTHDPDVALVDVAANPHGEITVTERMDTFSAIEL